MASSILAVILRFMDGVDMGLVGEVSPGVLEAELDLVTDPDLVPEPDLRALADGVSLGLSPSP